MANEPPQPNIGTNETNTGAVNVGSTFISTVGTNLEIRNQPDNQGSLVDVQAGTPDEENDLTTKAYVDAAIDGVTIQATCVAASNGHNIDLTKDVENGDSVDSIILFTNQLIVIKDQTDPTQNGVYLVSPENDPVRYPAATMLAGTIFYIEDGSTNHETFWKVVGSFTGPGGTPVYGTDPINFVHFIPTPSGGTDSGNEDDEQSMSMTLTYSSPATNILGTIGSNHSIYGIQVKVIQPFNGVNPELTIGDDTNGVSYLMTNDLSDLTVVDIYKDDEETAYTTTTPIKAYFAPGGATQGTAQIWINIEN